MYERTINNLQIAESINALELYWIVNDQRTPIIHCRIWDGVKLMAEADAKRFVDEYNAATEELRTRWFRVYRDKAANDLLHGRDIPKRD